MAGGHFTSENFVFTVEFDEWLPGVNQPFFGDDMFEPRIVESGRVPDLNGAPLASWLLSRLAHLTDDGVPSSGRERNDGGGWTIPFVVRDATNDRPVASFQLQGSMGGLDVVGDRAADCSSEQLLNALIAAVLDRPTDLMPCRLTVVDPEWRHDPDGYVPRPAPGGRNRYGWDGSRFLGRRNIRDAAG